MNFDWLKMQSRNNDGIDQNPFSRKSKSHQSCRIRSSKIEMGKLWLGLVRNISKNCKKFPFVKFSILGILFENRPKRCLCILPLFEKRCGYQISLYGKVCCARSNNDEKYALVKVPKSVLPQFTHQIKKKRVAILNRNLPHRLVLFLNPFEPHDCVHGDQLPQSIQPWPTMVSCSPWSGVHSTISPMVFAKRQSLLSTSTEPWIVVLIRFWNPTPHFSPFSCSVKQLWYPQDDQTLKMCSLSTLNLTASRRAIVETPYSTNISWIFEFLTW